MLQEQRTLDEINLELQQTRMEAEKLRQLEESKTKLASLEAEQKRLIQLQEAQERTNRLTESLESKIREFKNERGKSDLEVEELLAQIKSIVLRRAKVQKMANEIFNLAMEIQKPNLKSVFNGMGLGAGENPNGYFARDVLMDLAKDHLKTFGLSYPLCSFDYTSTEDSIGEILGILNEWSLGESFS